MMRGLSIISGLVLSEIFALMEASPVTYASQFSSPLLRSILCAFASLLVILASVILTSGGGPLLAQETPTSLPNTIPVVGIASSSGYLDQLVIDLQKEWPKNRRIHLLFHGHSVPAGYFATPIVRTLDAYPHLLLQKLGERFPTATIDVSVTAIGGENSEQGAARFAQDVLPTKPDVVFIDYALNDRRIGLERAEKAWRHMIDAARAQKISVVLLTPTLDLHETDLSETAPLMQHRASIQGLASEYQIPCVDSYDAMQRLVKQGTDPQSLMSQFNHPNRRGHEVVADLLVQLFAKP